MAAAGSAWLCGKGGKKMHGVLIITGLAYIALWLQVLQGAVAGGMRRALCYEDFQ